MTRQDYSRLQTRKLKGLKRGHDSGNAEEDVANNNNKKSKE